MSHVCIFVYRFAETASARTSRCNEKAAPLLYFVLLGGQKNDKDKGGLHCFDMFRQRMPLLERVSCAASH